MHPEYHHWTWIQHSHVHRDNISESKSCGLKIHHHNHHCMCVFEIEGQGLSRPLRGGKKQVWAFSPCFQNACCEALTQFCFTDNQHDLGQGRWVAMQRSEVGRLLGRTWCTEWCIHRGLVSILEENQISIKKWAKPRQREFYILRHSVNIVNPLFRLFGCWGGRVWKEAGT